MCPCYNFNSRSVVLRQNYFFVIVEYDRHKYLRQEKGPKFFLPKKYKSESESYKKNCKKEQNKKQLLNPSTHFFATLHAPSRRDCLQCCTNFGTTEAEMMKKGKDFFNHFIKKVEKLYDTILEKLQSKKWRGSPWFKKNVQCQQLTSPVYFLAFHGNCDHSNAYPCSLAREKKKTCARHKYG